MNLKFCGQEGGLMILIQNHWKKKIQNLDGLFYDPFQNKIQTGSPNDHSRLEF